MPKRTILALVALASMSTALVAPGAFAADDAKPAARPVTAVPASLLRFPTFGAAFAAPSGWSAIPNDKYKTIAQWVTPGGGEAERSLITVEAGIVVGPSLEQVASKLAQGFNGEVLPDATTLDGERALRVRAVPEEDDLSPVEAVVCYHGDDLYLIMGGVAGGAGKGEAQQGRLTTCREQVDAVRQSWRWIAFEPPVQHLAFRDQPLEAFEGTVTLNVPALMHVKPDEEPAKRIQLSLYDLKKGAAQFTAFAEVAQMPPGLSFAEVKERFLLGMAGRAKLTPAPSWQERGGPSRVVTQCVEAAPAAAVDKAAPAAAAAAAPAPDAKKHLQWALVSLGDDRLVLLNFTHTADCEEDRKAYEAVAAKIVDSVAATGRKPATPATRPIE